MWFAFDLIDEGRISPRDFVAALRQQLRCRRPIGQLAVEMGWMSMQQVFTVLSKQAEANQPFGELAIALGFLDRPQLSELIIRQLESVPKLEDILVEHGAISQRDLEHSLERLRGQMGMFRERQFESLSEEVCSERAD